MAIPRKITYVEYLHLDRVLSAQHPISSGGPEVHTAEQLFIRVHQGFELWFGQVLLDLGCATKALRPRGDVHAALLHLRRVRATLELLRHHMARLDHLPPGPFLWLRRNLDEISAAQPAQFPVIQGALGIRAREASPLYTAFLAALEREDVTPEEIVQAPGRCWTLYVLLEALVDVSDAWHEVWVSHLGVVERLIGRRRGTGGSSGASYLESLLEARAFPELLDLAPRSAATTGVP